MEIWFGPIGGLPCLMLRPTPALGPLDSGAETHSWCLKRGIPDRGPNFANPSPNYNSICMKMCFVSPC